MMDEAEARRLAHDLVEIMVNGSQDGFDMFVDEILPAPHPALWNGHMRAFISTFREECARRRIPIVGPMKVLMAQITQLESEAG